MLNVNIDSPDDITNQLKNMGIESDAVPQKISEIKNTSPKDAGDGGDEGYVESETQKNDEEEKEEGLLDPPDTSDLPSDTAVEDQARAKGWRPGGVKSADEFMRADPLYSEIKARGKEIKELKGTLDSFKDYMDQQKAGEEARVRKAVEQARLDAIEIGDVAGVDAADEKLKQLAPDPAVPQVAPEVTDFLARNSEWMQGKGYQDIQMQEYVHQRDEQLGQPKFGLTTKQHMEYLERDVKAKFPDRFGGSNVHAVESDSAPARTKLPKTKFTFADLNPEQKKVARYFEKRKVMTMDKYIDSLRKNGDLV